MPKTKISEFSATPANNTDIDSINIAEGCAPSGINDAIRELMAQLKDFQTGAVGDSFNGPIGSSTASTGAFTTLTTTGTINNLTVGRGAGAVSTNTAVGASALAANTTGSNNVAIGYQAMTVSTDTSYNVAVGRLALASQSSGGNLINTAVGNSALTANTTGYYNTAVGGGSLAANTTALNNSAFGYQALASNTTASNNTAVGYQAGYSNTTGTSNTFLGVSAGTACTTGSANTLIGNNAGASLTTGSRNTFIGNSNQVTGNTGSLITTGSANTIVGNYTGNQGGLDIRTASNNIVLSDGDGNPRGIFNGSGNFILGSTSLLFGGERLKVNATGSGSNTAFFSFDSTDDRAVVISAHNGSSGGTVRKHYAFLNSSLVEVGYIGVTGSGTNYATSSDYRLKNTIAPMTEALAKVALLKPCTYKWNVDGSDGEGFIAHELAEVVPQCVTGEKDAVDEDGNPKYQGIDTSFLVATLTAALQEQQAIIKSQSVAIEALKARLDAANL